VGWQGAHANHSSVNFLCHALSGGEIVLSEGTERLSERFLKHAPGYDLGPWVGRTTEERKEK
jgi:hypothetical protein